MSGDSEDEILFEEDIDSIVIDRDGLDGKEPSMSEMVNERSYELTGLSLEELIYDIVKDLKVTPGNPGRDVREIFDMSCGDEFGRIAYLIGMFHYCSDPYGIGRAIYPSGLELLVSRVGREIYFGTMKHTHPSGYRGLADKVLSELPKRLELNQW